MTSDAGFNSQDTDYARHIQEVLDELRQMQQLPQLVTSPEALEALEREIRQRTDRLWSLLVGHHLQQALDADAFQAEQEQLPVFSANNPPGHARERGRKSSPGAALRAGGGGRSAH